MTDAAVPRRYVLDAGIFVALQRARYLSVLVDISAHAEMVVLEEVREELIDKAKPKYPKAAEQIRVILDDSQIVVESIDASDPAAYVMAALRAGKTSDADMGEAASIAWTISQPEAVFVTRDAAGAFRALEERRGRVMGFFQFLAELVESGALESSVAGQIADDVARTPGVMARAPLWWADWIRSRSSGST